MHWSYCSLALSHLYILVHQGLTQCGAGKHGQFLQISDNQSGLDIKHFIYMPTGHVVLKIYVPWKSFHVPSQYLYKPCKAYVYCWKNKYMPTLKNHMPCRACNHKCLCALGQDLHAPGMRACLDVEPCQYSIACLWGWAMECLLWIYSQIYILH